MDFELKKYPRTPHLEGSRLQPGDEDLSQIPFSDIEGKYLVIEEKIDGANSAVSFSEDGELSLQSLSKKWSRCTAAMCGNRPIYYNGRIIYQNRRKWLYRWPPKICEGFFCTDNCTIWNALD